MLGTILKEIREEQGLSQAALAEKTCLSRSYIALIELNKKVPRIEQLEIICKALNKSLPTILMLTQGNSNSKVADILRELEPLMKQMNNILGIKGNCSPLGITHEKNRVAL